MLKAKKQAEILATKFIEKNHGRVITHAAFKDELAELILQSDLNGTREYERERIVKYIRIRFTNNYYPTKVTNKIIKRIIAGIRQDARTKLHPIRIRKV